MLVAAMFAATLLFDGSQVAVIAGAAPPAEARPAGDSETTRRVCRLERATGSNIQQRVCRDIPRAGFQDQQTREFLGAMQRVQVPEGGIRVSPLPAGGPLD